MTRLTRMGPIHAQKGHRQSGYSLLELLVVLAILGLIVAIAAPRVVGFFQTSKVKAAKIQVANLSSALEIYKLSNGNYPAEQVGLKALVEKPDGVTSWDGPYLTRADGINDPWGKPYIYRMPGSHGSFDIMSWGADGKEGGEGEAQDIVSWQ